jgi:hypothetical protein
MFTDHGGQEREWSMVNPEWVFYSVISFTGKIMGMKPVA